MYASSVGGFALNSLPKRSSVYRKRSACLVADAGRWGGKLTDRVGVDVVKVLELPRCPGGYLVSPPLPLLILHHQ